MSKFRIICHNPNIFNICCAQCSLFAKTVLLIHVQQVRKDKIYKEMLNLVLNNKGHIRRVEVQYLKYL